MINKSNNLLNYINKNLIYHNMRTQTPSRNKKYEDNFYKKEDKNIKQAIRKLVWHHYIGYKTGLALCWCCNVTPINVFEFECGHVIARSKGGADTIKNLRPICGSCNRSMGNQNMLEFQKEHGLPKQKSYWEYFKSFLGY